MSLSPELRQHQDGMDKYMLRSAFDQCDILPYDTLWSENQSATDMMPSMASTWKLLIQEYCQNQVPMFPTCIYT